MASSLSDAMSQPLTGDKTLEEAASINNNQLPTSPLSATAQGAGPDAAKMAGTKIQKRSAQLKQERAKPEAASLSYQDRIAQARSSRTEAEESAAKRAAQLQQLGSLGTRVSDVIQSNIQTSLEEQEAAVTVDEAGAEVLAGFDKVPQDQQAEALSMLSEYYSADPERQMRILVDLKNKFGVDVDQSNINDMIGGIEQATGKSVADLTMDNVTIGSMGADQLAQMGIADTAEMAELLGVPEEQVTGMSLAQLIQQVEAVEAADYAQVAEIQRQLADPATSESERVALRKQLRDLGGVGMTGVEQQVESLADVVDQAGTITVEGQEMSVEEFLSDEKFSKAIEDLLAPSTDPTTKAELEKLLGPEAVGMIQEHADAFKDLAASARSGVAKFDTVQAKREATKQDLLKHFDSDKDKKLLEDLFPGWDKAGTGDENWTSSNLYQAVTDPNDVDSMLDFVFGEDVKEATIQAQFDKLKELANAPAAGGFGSLDSPAAEKLRRVSSILDSDGDGTIDSGALIDTLRDKGKKGLLNEMKSLSGALSSAGSDLIKAKQQASEAQASIDADVEQAKQDEQTAKQEAEAAKLYDKIKQLVAYSPTSTTTSKLLNQYKQLTGRQWSADFRNKNPVNRMTPSQKTDFKKRNEYKDYIKTLDSWKRPSYEEWLRGKR